MPYTTISAPAGRPLARHAANAAMLLTGLLVSPLVMLPAAAQGIDLPARKPGLWEISMQMEGMPTQNMRHCVDEKTDRQMQRAGRGVSENCTPGTPRKDGNALVYEQECQMGKSRVSSRTVMTGDFNSKVHTEVSSTYNPPLAGRANSKMVMDAKWAGSCPAGWKPGDMEMPGGMRMNVGQMMQGLPARK